VPDPDAPVHRLLSIPGQPPDLAGDLTGCAFAARCPFVADACTAATPPLVAVTPQRASACLRHEEWDRWTELVTAGGPLAGHSAGMEE